MEISGEDDALAMRVEAKGANAKLSHNAADFLTNPVPNRDSVEGSGTECPTTLSVNESAWSPVPQV